MGAALTYARRYALFTLVGIAGEDDLDAPELAAPTNKAPGPERLQGQGDGKPNGAEPKPPSQHRAASYMPATSTLGTEPSALLRDRLIAEVRELGSSDEAATWAHKKLADKNKLTAADSRAVEDAFQAKLETCVLTSTHASEFTENTSSGRTSPNRRAAKPKQERRIRAIDKSVQIPVSTRPLLPARCGSKATRRQSGKKNQRQPAGCRLARNCQHHLSWTF